LLNSALIHSDDATEKKFTAILLVIVRPDRLSGHVRSRRFPPLGLDGGVNPPPYAHRAP